MDANSIVQLIGSLGFPVVMCLLFFWWNAKTNEQHHEEIKNMQEQHTLETKELSEAINNNTLVMQKLIDKLEGN